MNSSNSRDTRRRGSSNDNAKPKMLIAYVIVESKTDDQKAFWNQIGVAFVNRDGSINVKLDAVPVDGKLQLRERQENDGGAR